MSNRVRPAGKQLLTLALLLVAEHHVTTGGQVGDSASAYLDRPTSSELLYN